MEVCVLSSGSKGNCALLTVANKNILIDCGINGKQLEFRLNLVGKSISDIDAVFITHEHSDHIAGCRVLSNKNKNTKFYFNKGTYENCKFEIAENQLKFFENGILNYEGIEVRAFEKNHDAADPVTFAFIKDGKKATFITDIGSVCNKVIDQIKGSDILVFEFNHDEAMLLNGPYPPHLKHRIHGNKGHLSNMHAVDCLINHIDDNLKHLFLAHISSTNNNKLLAKKMIENALPTNANILLTHEHTISDIVKLD